MKYWRKSKAAQNGNDREKDGNTEEMWTAGNVREKSSSERIREETSYFDPSYDYMGAE